MNIGVVDIGGNRIIIALPAGTQWTASNGRLECGNRGVHCFFDSGHYQGFHTRDSEGHDPSLRPGKQGMKIIVLSDPAFGGGQETIDLPDGTCWQVVHGYTMNHIHGTHGFDHFFNFDGTYDGWGGRIGPCSTEAASELLTAQEDARRYAAEGRDKS